MTTEELIEILKSDAITIVKLDGNGYVASVENKDYGFDEVEEMLTFLQDYLMDSSIVKPENRYFN